MSVQLLDKTRKINKLLHNNHSHRVEFNDICEVLSGILESNILVISQKGKILGAASYSGIDKIGELITADTGGFVDNMLNERLLGVLSTKENVNLLTLGFSGGSERKFKALIAPVDIAGERLGTLFIYKCVADYDIDDIILNVLGGIIGYIIYKILKSIGQSLPSFCRKEWFLDILSILILVFSQNENSKN